MLDNDFACRELTEIVRETLDAEDVLASKRHEQLFVSLVKSQKERKQRMKKIRIGLRIAAIAAAAIIVTSIALVRLPGDLSFKVGSAASDFVTGEPGEWVQADTGESMQIKFDQGSSFEVKDGCAARVVESGEEAVTIELSKGDISADVKGNKKTRWKINAGPFTVTVLGTAFDVSWDAASNAFDVKVRRGAVLVQGAGLSRHGVRLLAGQHLAANGRSGEISLKSPGTVTAEKTQVIDSEAGSASQLAVDDELIEDTMNMSSHEEVDKSDADLSASKRHPGKSGVGHSLKNSFDNHYKEGRYADAVRAAEKEGLSRLYQNADAKTLWNLADAARNARRVSVSNESLIALRKRFPGSKKAQLAAFIIGRSAMDVSHNPSLAAQWFQAYLVESPGGAMCEEVHGRLMSIYTQMNRPAAAKRIATQYLRQYPAGLYAGRANQVLQK